MIWFRIEYDDAYKYKVMAKLGEVTFTSDYRYLPDELPKVIESLCELDTSEEEHLT